METTVKKFPGRINILHSGCWASDFTTDLIQKFGREDLELFVFPRNITKETYEALAVVQSRERKIIGKGMRSKMMLNLLGHKVVRVVEHVNDLESAVVLYMTILDTKTRGAVRLLPATASIHQDVGMPVYNGVEGVIAFYEAPADFFSTIEDMNANRIPLRKFHGKEGYIKEWEIRDSIVWPEGIVEEPTFLFNIMAPKETLDEEEKSKLLSLLKEGHKKTSELLEFVNKHLPWIYPILRKIIEIAQKGRRPFLF